MTLTIHVDPELALFKPIPILLTDAKIPFYTLNDPPKMPVENIELLVVAEDPMPPPPQQPLKSLPADSEKNEGTPIRPSTRPSTRPLHKSNTCTRNLFMVLAVAMFVVFVTTLIYSLNHFSNNDPCPPDSKLSFGFVVMFSIYRLFSTAVLFSMLFMDKHLAWETSTRLVLINEVGSSLLAFIIFLYAFQSSEFYLADMLSQCESVAVSTTILGVEGLAEILILLLIGMNLGCID